MASPEKDDNVEQLDNAPGVGALLKASRLRIGDDLRDISGVLRIRHVFLEAIEDGRFDDLPGTTYATGFIRAYADHLGLDSEEVVRRYKIEVSGESLKSELDFPEPIPEPGIPGGAIVFVGIVVVAVAYGAWYVNTSKDGFLVEMISPVPDRLSRLSSDNEKAADEAKEEAPKSEEAKEETPEAAEAKEETPEAVPPAETETASQPATESSGPESQPETAPESTPETTAESTPETAPEPEAKPETAAAPAAEPAAEPAAVPQDVIPEAPPPVETAVAEQASGETDTRPAEAETAPVEIYPPEPAPAETAAATPEPVPETPAAAPEPVPETPAAVPAPAAAPVAATAQAGQPKPPPESPAEITQTPETASLKPAGAVEGSIVIRAKTNSWIQVRDENAGELIVTRLLRAGDSYAVPKRPGLQLSTGNAGALEILVDGEPVPSIGGAGTVLRKVELDPEKLKAGTAVSE